MGTHCVLPKIRRGAAGSGTTHFTYVLLVVVQCLRSIKHHLMTAFCLATGTVVLNQCLSVQAAPANTQSSAFVCSMPYLVLRAAAGTGVCVIHREAPTKLQI
jgi:hypothetical protein